MTTEKHRFMVYLADEDMDKLNFLVETMYADSWSEVVRRLVREKYDQEKEKHTKDKK